MKAYESEETLKNYFIQQLKESAYLRFGSIQSIRQLELESIEPIWAGHVQSRVEDYDQLYGRLTLTGSAWEHVPVAWYLGTQRRYTDAIHTETDGHLTTVAEGIAALLLGRVASESDPDVMRTLREAGGAVPDALAVVVQGVSVPLETPLLWLALNMGSPDQFVHVVVRPKEDFLVLV